MRFLFRFIRRFYIFFRNCKIKLLDKNIEIGEHLNYRANFRINCNEKGLLIIGDNCFFNNDCSINVHKSVVIGNECIFGECVKVYDHNHVFNNCSVPIYKSGFSCKPVVIGDNCWIGSNVVILPGTKVGKGSVIGSGTVLSGIIPPNTIVKQNRDYVLIPINYRNYH